ncbi:MAG: lamin tail domain-containing protein [candidate division Zixibacteria bacterium]|nr:lamin tail domain-containing protein [candidate division Zixibacteria bacterium]
MRTVFAVLSTVLFSLPAFAQAPKVVINEVLANEPGSFTSLEWIELFNVDANSAPLSDFSIVVGNDTSRLDSGSVILPANGFAVVSRKPVAEYETENSFEKQWGDNSGIWGDEAAENYPLLKGKFTLNNASGRVLLLHQGNPVDSFIWTADSGDGKSYERIAAASPAAAPNIAVSRASSGSTPGKINSVAPVANDLAIEQVTAQTLTGFTARFSGTVKNVGLDSTVARHLFFSIGVPGDTGFTALQILDSTQITALATQENDAFTIDLILPSGYQRIVISLPLDGRNENNFAAVTIKNGAVAPTLLINEFLPDPASPLESEWIELYNAADTAAELFGWKIGDAKSQVAIVVDSTVIPAKSFTIVANDKTGFQAFYPNVTAPIFQPASWPALNNDGDTIKLVSPFGLLEDSIGYGEGYGGNVSWEKKDPALPSDNLANWWRSVDVKGATPGSQNSIAAAYSENLGVDISPNPFSPDGDGFDDEVTINFTLPFQANLTARIYDLNGREVKTLLDNSPTASSQLRWDGKGNNGKTLRSGIYVLFMETSGSARLTKKGTIVLVKKK